MVGGTGGLLRGACGVGSSFVHLPRTWTVHRANRPADKTSLGLHGTLARSLHQIMWILRVGLPKEERRKSEALCRPSGKGVGAAGLIDKGICTDTLQGPSPLAPPPALHSEIAAASMKILSHIVFLFSQPQQRHPRQPVSISHKMTINVILGAQWGKFALPPLPGMRPSSAPGRYRLALTILTITS